MQHEIKARDGVTIHVEISGPDSGPPVVFANSLGTTLHLWDQVLPLLPDGLRIIRFDKRGHGKSDVPAAPYTMGTLVSDAEAVCDAFEVRDCMFVGLSVGGMIAQGLAVKRLDIVRAMVLSCTAAKIGTKALWDDRIAAIKRVGMSGIADGVMERWFGSQFRMSPEVKPWKQMLIETPAEGYVGVCSAIAGTDFFTPTSGLRLPTLGIAGTEDRATPPDLVRETVELIPGSKLELISKAGHLPCAERPEAYAALLSAFLKETGHID